jgi:hypothetical protein
MSASGGEAWSDRRKRFLLVFPQRGGSTSNAGEIWYAEADTPMGPWVYTTKILTHGGDTFLSPWMHPYFQQDGGRFAFFEGAYTTAQASGSLTPTPYYNRNQIMYRLDLEDERLILPVPIYDTSQGLRRDFADKRHLPSGTIDAVAPFFALDRPASGAIPVAWSGPACAPRKLVVGGSPTSFPLFYAFAPAGSPPPGAIPLYDFVGAGGDHAYDVTMTPVTAGFVVSPEPIAYVWSNPLRVAFPVGDFIGPLVANAGPDQCLTESAAGYGADVTLDGSGSLDTAGTIVSYAWTIAGQACPAASGVRTAVHLPAGTYGIELQVTDAAGTVSRDDMIVAVTAL